MPDSKNETGPTWTGYFPTGKIGIMPMPATPAGPRQRRPQARDVGVAPIAGIKGGAVDLRRRRRHRHLEGQQGRRPGLELPVLADDRGRPGRRPRQGRQRRLPHRPRQQPVQRGRPAPRHVQHGRGQGPDAVRPQLRPDVQRPAGPVARPAPGRGLRRRQQDRRGQRRDQRVRCSRSSTGAGPATGRPRSADLAITGGDRGRHRGVRPAHPPPTRRPRGWRRARRRLGRGCTRCRRPSSSLVVLRHPAAARGADVAQQLAAAQRRQGLNFPTNFTSPRTTAVRAGGRRSRSSTRSWPRSC